MSFILVKYGYNDSRVFNINCNTAPLMDAINERACRAILKTLKSKQTEFNNTIQKLKGNINFRTKKLENIDKSLKEVQKTCIYQNPHFFTINHSPLNKRREKNTLNIIVNYITEYSGEEKGRRRRR
jgi:hypothetical protein